MRAEIREESPSAALANYASVPIAFEVRERLTVDAAESGTDGLQYCVEPLQPPYVKDYDTEPGNAPGTWATRFDLERWAMFSAWAGNARIGGALVVRGDAKVEMLEGRSDLALLWDLRVAPEWRGRGVGATLFSAVEQWALSQGARWLKVETQDVNVPACRFYAAQGCLLRSAHRFAYPALPDELQLLWYKRLGPSASHTPPS